MFGRSPSFAVLFDMDGTLIDSEPYWLASEQALAKEHNGTWTHEDGLSVVGMSLDESSKLFKDKANIDLEPQEIVTRLTSDVQSQLQKIVPWRPGARELLFFFGDHLTIHRRTGHEAVAVVVELDKATGPLQTPSHARGIKDGGFVAYSYTQGLRDR